MQTYHVQASNGKTYAVNAPSGATPALLQRFVDESLNPPAPVQPVDDRGDFKRGLDSTIPQLKALAGGLTALVGDTVGSEGLQKYGMDVYQRNMAESQKGAKETDDWVTSWQKAQEGNPGSLIDTLQYWSGYGAGQAGETLALGLISGGVAGMANIAGRGALKSLVSHAIEKKAVERLGDVGAKKAINMLVAEGATREAAEAQIKNQILSGVTKDYSQKIGAGAALYLNSATQELGSIYPEAVDQNSGQLLDPEQLRRVWGAGLSAAAVEAAADYIGLDKALHFKGKTLPFAQAARIAVGQVAQGTAREGITEGIQTAIERFGANQPLTGDAANRDYINSSLAGVVGGFQAGAIPGAKALLAARKPVQEEQDPNTQTEQPPGQLAPPANADVNFDDDEELLAALKNWRPNQTAPAAVEPPSKRLGLTPEQARQRAPGFETQREARGRETQGQVDTLRQPLAPQLPPGVQPAPSGGGQFAPGMTPYPAPMDGKFPAVVPGAARVPVATDFAVTPQGQAIPAAQVPKQEQTAFERKYAPRPVDIAPGSSARPITMEDVAATGVKYPAKKWLTDNVVGKTQDELRQFMWANPKLFADAKQPRTQVLNSLLKTPLVAPDAPQALQGAVAQAAPSNIPWLKAYKGQLQAKLTPHIMRPDAFNAAIDAERRALDAEAKRLRRQGKGTGGVEAKRAALTAARAFGVQHRADAVANQPDQTVLKSVRDGAPPVRMPHNGQELTREDAVALKKAGYNFSPASLYEPQNAPKGTVFATFQGRPFRVSAPLKSVGDGAPTGAAHTPQSLTQQLHRALGHGFTSALMNAGHLRVDLSRGTTDADAEFFRKTRVTKLYADNIPSTITDHQLRKLTLHEIGVHALRAGRNSAQWKHLLSELQRLHKLGNKDVVAAHGRALFGFGLSSLPSQGFREHGGSSFIDSRGNTVPYEDLLSEVAAYLVQDAPKASITRRIITWFKELLQKLFPNLKLAPGDVVAMAEAAFARAPQTLNKQDAPSVGGEFAMASNAAPVWYSQLKRVMDQQGVKARPGNEWKQWLANNMSKFGVRKEEVEATGISEYLSMLGSKMVPATEIAAFVEQNGVQVEEKEYNEKPVKLSLVSDFSDRPFIVEDEDEQEVARFTTRDAAEAAIELHERNARSKGAPWKQYTTIPGGEYYRVMVLKLPENEDPRTFDLALAVKEAEYALNEADDALTLMRRRMQSRGRLPPQEVDALVVGYRAAHVRVEERNAAVRAAREAYSAVAKQPFTSGHYPEKNIIATARFSTFYSTTGERLLGIHELQSDWGAKLKPGKWEEKGDFGYSFASEKEAQAFIDENPMLGIDEDMASARKNDGLEWRLRPEKTTVWKDGAHHTVFTIIEDVRFKPDTKTPRGPYVTDTKAWTALVLKRMLRYAVDNGFEGIVLPTGEQVHKTFPTKENGESSLSSMQGYYDEIAPQVLREVLKKVGGGTVRRIGIYTGIQPVYQIRDGRGQLLMGGFPSQERAAEAIAAIRDTGLVPDSDYRVPPDVSIAVEPQFPEDETAPREQQGVMLNDKLRETVSQGMSLFSKRDPNVLKSVSYDDTVTPKQSESKLDAIASTMRGLGDRAVGNTTANDVEEFLTGKLSRAAKTVWLSSQPLHVLVDFAQNKIPPAKVFLDLVRRFTGAMQAVNPQFETIYKSMDEWRKKSTPAMVARFNTLVFDADRDHIDMRKDLGDYEYGSHKWNTYKELKVLYDGLDEQGKDIYKQQRAMYDRLYNDVVNQIRKTVNVATGQPSIATSISTLFYKKLSENGALEGYAPHVREGDYILTYKRAALDQGLTPFREDVVKFFKSKRERQEFIRALPTTEPKLIAGSVKMPIKLSRDAFRNAPSGSFLHDLVKVLTQSNVDDGVIDQIMRLAVQMMPETSAAQNLVHRKDTPGYETDAFKAFQQNAIRMRKRTLSLEYAAQFGQVKRDIAKLKEDALKHDQAGIDMAEELDKRIEFAISPYLPGWSHMLRTGLYTMTLGLNPSSALIDMAAIPMVFYPYLKARHMGQSVLGAFTEASKVFFGSPRVHAIESYLTAGLVDTPATDDAPADPALTEARNAAGLTAHRDIRNVPAWYSIANYNFDTVTDPRVKRLKTLANKLSEQGQIQRFSKFDDIDALGEGNRLAKLNAYQGIMMQGSERIRRELGAIASYNLALDKIEKGGKKPTQADMDRAAQNAVDFLEATSGGLSNLSSPRWSHSGLGAVAALYKKYGLTIYYHQLKMLREMTKSEDPDTRKMAWRQFGIMMASSALFAGVRGMPLIGLLAVAYNKLKDEDDDDFNTMLDKSIGRGFASGAVDYLTGMGVSTRIAQTNLLVRDNPGNEERTFADMFGVYLGGPAFGIGERMVRGSNLIERGFYWRGIENMLPIAASNVMKAVRFATEGTRTVKGDAITGDVPLFNVLTQSVGFTPAEYGRAQERVTKLREHDVKMAEAKGSILQRLYVAQMAGDMDAVREMMAEDVAEFNKKYPYNAITGTTLRKSMQQRRRDAMKRVYGSLPASPEGNRQYWLSSIQAQGELEE